MKKTSEIYHNFGDWPLFVGDSPFQLPLYISCLGHEKRSNPTYCWDGMKRGKNEMFIWQYTLKGHGWLRIGSEQHGTICRVEPGMAMCLPVPGEHCYYYQEETPSAEWEFVFMDIAGLEASHLGHQFIEQHGMLVSLQQESETVVRFLQFANAFLKGRKLSRYENCSIATDFFMSLFQECSSETHSSSYVIRRCQEFCQEHFQEKLSLERLARFAGYSKYHFSRMFYEAAGMNIPEFVERLRLKQATLMLQGTGRNSVKEIATCCGFDNTSYFCRVFKQHFGVTPQQWRNGK